MTISLAGRGVRAVLLDVEGTTTPVSFVYNVLFPYARARLKNHVAPDVAARLEALMDEDSKDPGLKELQGIIWNRGYRDGSLRGDVYDDVPEAFVRWRSAGVKIAIYSSGSVLAQQMLFGYSIHGDLRHFIAQHFDTLTGPKREPKSYEKIAAALGLEPREVLFFSDVHAELDAARAAGMQVVLSVRAGNAESALPGEESVSGLNEVLA